jgi:hypothetical protein
MANGVRVSVERKATLAERKAVSYLLDIVYDAVVELDDGGRIDSPAQGLSCLWLHQGSPSNSLRGTTLQSLLHTDDDQERFESFLEERSEAKSAVRHFDMRDTCGTPIRMEIFKVAFAPSGGSKVRYLIGIKEQSDFDRVPRLREVPEANIGVREDLARELRSFDGHNSDESVGSSDEVESRLSRTEERFEDGNLPTSMKAIEVSLMLVWIAGGEAQIRPGPAAPSMRGSRSSPLGSSA